MDYIGSFCMLLHFKVGYLLLADEFDIVCTDTLVDSDHLGLK